MWSRVNEPYLTYLHLPVRMLGTAEVTECPVLTISTADTLYAVANILLPSNSDYDLREHT